MEFKKIFYRDGYSGSFRWWSGGGKGAVVYIHGIQSHGLWFEESAGVLAGAGFDVLLADRRGSGVNREGRGDVLDYRQWIDDYAGLVDWVTENNKVDRVHVVGVSWGGKIAVALAKMMPGRIASLSLVAPGIFPAVDVCLSEKFKIAVSVIFCRKKYFEIPLNEAELFTDNPERQEFIRRDELKLTRVTGNFLYQSRRLDRFVRKTNRRLTMPVKMFLAGRERIIDNEATVRYYRGLRTSSVKELRFYPEAYHTLEFGADNQRFLLDLKEWLERCV